MLPSGKKQTLVFAKPFRFEWQQAILKEELSRITQREKESTKKGDSLWRTRHTMSRKVGRRKKLFQAAFYRFLLIHNNLNKEIFKNRILYFLTCIMVKMSCSTAPVCSGLQAQILSCYRDNRDQTLKCSDLAKEYLQCINAARKSINHGSTIG
uniref:CHCH domain-containing protein n=1 Tax=Oryzias sinensis TaxID=183150 RepID=A0A8C8DY78_9TELE